jgi:hypothetical protein
MGKIENTSALTAMSDQHSPRRRIQFRLRTLLIAVTLLAVVVLTATWAEILARGNYCWNAFAFMMVAGGVSIGMLLFVIVPNGVAYFRRKQPGDRICLVLAAVSFTIVVAEIVAVLLLPMKGE